MFARCSWRRASWPRRSSGSASAPDSSSWITCGAFSWRIRQADSARAWRPQAAGVKASWILPAAVSRRPRSSPAAPCAARRRLRGSIQAHAGLSRGGDQTRREGLRKIARQEDPFTRKTATAFWTAARSPRPTWQLHWRADRSFQAAEAAPASRRSLRRADRASVSGCPRRAREANRGADGHRHPGASHVADRGSSGALAGADQKRPADVCARRRSCSEPAS